MRNIFKPIEGRCAEIVDAILAAPEMPADDELQFKVRLCVEEIVENVCNYAYPDGNGWLEVSVENDGNSVLMTFRDGGTPFDPLAKPDPDITLSAEDRQIGGLGIFLCKQMMDSVEYVFEDSCNVLKMSKNH